MKLQIAFDIPDLEKCITIAKQVEPYSDRFEIGAILLYKYGIVAIQEFRKNFEKKVLVAETQLVDHGKDITNLCIQAGADWVTVMAGTSKPVIHSVCSAAGSYKKDVMLDLLDTNFIGESSMEAQSLGVDAILFHKSQDDNSENFLATDKWEMVRGNTKLPVYVASAINRNNIEQTMQLKPDGIIISKAITQHADPKTEAEYFYNLINEKS